jgi:uncharacterized protein (UPF0333 family)
MVFSTKKLLLAGLLAVGMGSLSYGQQSAKEDIKDAGKATKNAAVKTGSATKKVAKKAANATVEGAEKTGSAVKRGTKKVVNKSAKAVEKGADKVGDKTQPK